MVCLAFKPRAAGWQAQTKPRSYGGRPSLKFFYDIDSRFVTLTNHVQFCFRLQTKSHISDALKKVTHFYIVLCNVDQGPNIAKLFCTTSVTRGWNKKRSPFFLKLPNTSHSSIYLKVQFFKIVLKVAQIQGLNVIKLVAKCSKNSPILSHWPKLMAT